MVPRDDLEQKKAPLEKFFIFYSQIAKKSQKSVILGGLTKMTPCAQPVRLRTPSQLTLLQFKVHIRTGKNLKKIGDQKFSDPQPSLAWSEASDQAGEG